MRFARTCYRAHDPRWAFKPVSGDGAAVHGARFNPKGVLALYLSLDIMTAIKEASQGFPHRLDPLVLCAYEVDCEDVADLTTERGRNAESISPDVMNCPWALALADGNRPSSWSVYDRLSARGVCGTLVPSFAARAEADARNLVLWNWGPNLPHAVQAFDPSHRLPRDQLSWG